MNRHHRPSIVMGVLAATGLASAVLAASATPSRAALPPAAQAAVSQGLAAAQQQQWLVAIDRFQEARKLAPDALELFGDLGLAESKIPGRELRAIAWFGAYLAARPDAPNVAAVKALIAGLQSKSEANTRRLVSALEDAARLTVHNQEDALGSVAGLWAEAGGLPAAMRIVDRIQSTHSKSWALLTIVEAQLKLGDVAGAVRSAEPMQDTFYKSVALKEIAEVQAEAGEIETALETASAIQHPVYKGRALIAIARAQAASNDLSDARNTIRAASLAESNDGGTPTDASDIASIEAEITRASKATPTATSPVRVRNVAPAIQRSDWTERLDDSWIAHDGALNTAPFLNMAAYLDDQHAQTPNLWSEREQDWLFSNLLDKAKKIVAAQIVIEKMVKQQTKLEAYP